MAEYSNEGAVCPYCLHLNRARDSDGLLYDEGTIDWECWNCEEKFDVTVRISYSWTTKKIERAKNWLEGGTP